MKKPLTRLNQTTSVSFLKPWRQLILILLLCNHLPSVAPAQTKQWDKTFGGNGIDLLFSLQQTSDGGYILGGYSWSGISGDKSEANEGGDFPDYWIVKLDAAGNKQWDKTFGGSFNDELTSLQQTSDGGYILGGTSSSPISGDKSEANKGECSGNYCIPDYWVVKLNAAGQKEWDKTFGGSKDDALTSLQQTSDGGYILGGWSRSGVSGDKTEASRGSGDYWVVKLDAAGQKEWDKTFGGSDWDGLASLQQTNDGGYLLGGSSWSNISGDKTEVSRGDFDYWVVKLNAAGQKEWDKTFGGSDSDQLTALQQTSDGGYILGGTSWSGISEDKTEASRGYFDYWIVKLDASGQKEWDKTFGGSDWDGLASLQQTNDGGYLLGGSSWSNISGDKTEANSGCEEDHCPADYWVVKLDAAGRKQWDKTFGGSDSDGLASLQQTNDGGYLLGGSSWSDISGDKTEANRGLDDYWVVKLGDTNICNQTVQSFTLVNADNHTAIMPLKDGDVIDLSTMPTQNLKIKAFTNPSTVGSVIFHLDGKQVAVEGRKPYRYGGIGKFTVGTHTLTATPYCGPKGTGAKGTARTLQFQVIQSDPVTAIRDVQANSSESISHKLQAFPNPFSEQTAILFTVPEPGDATLEVYDLKGALVECLYQQRAEPGKTYTVYLQRKQLPGGVYITRLATGKQLQHLKLVLTR